MEEKIYESVELNKKIKHETMNGDTILDVCNILHVTKVFLLFGRFSPTLRRHKKGKKKKLQCQKKKGLQDSHFKGRGRGLSVWEEKKTLWARPDTTSPGALQNGEPNRIGGGHYKNQQW